MYFFFEVWIYTPTRALEITGIKLLTSYLEPLTSTCQSLVALTGLSQLRLYQPLMESLVFQSFTGIILFWVRKLRNTMGDLLTKWSLNTRNLWRNTSWHRWILNKTKCNFEKCHVVSTTNVYLFYPKYQTAHQPCFIIFTVGFLPHSRNDPQICFLLKIHAPVQHLNRFVLFANQIDGFEYGPNGMGWFFWNAKIENDGNPEWNYLFLLKKGIVPANLCQKETVCDSKLIVVYLD